MTLEQIRQSASFVREKACFGPEIGVILGTGLGGLVDHIDVQASIDYSEIPNFPVSTVEGHHGRLIFGTLGGKRVVAMQGRFHYYEGYTPQQVVLPVRVMKLLGIKYLFVSNASGGVNPSFRTGDLMVITDHINLIPNPLIGPNIGERGTRFPDMNDAYDPALIDLAGQTASRLGIKLQYGCYVGGTGPTFETQKEYGYFRAIGGDTVGMSTTPEVNAARHMLIPVFGVSVITNLGLSGEKSTHEEVQREGARAAVDMTRLFTEMIGAL
ncbi:MAG: purine-nucleoside phosphorylase [Alistipes sp.]|nr:purine-nucleoside phosphorylase [Alistipes sp.]